MDTIKKILGLISDNWGDVLDEAQRLETYIDKGHDFVDAQEATVKDLFEKIPIFLDIDWQKVKGWLFDTNLYQHLEKIPHDVPEWISVPEGFDWNDEAQRNALITEKAELLRTALANVSIKTGDGNPVDISLAVDQVKEIVDATIAAIPEDFDLGDGDELEQLKTAITDSVRPKVLALIQTLFGIDLHNSEVISTLDDSIDTISELPQKLKDAQPNPVDAQPDPDLSPEIAQALDMISKAKYGLPVLQQELKQFTSGHAIFNDLFEGTEDFVENLEQHFQAMAEALMQLIDNQDWNNLDFEQLKIDLKELFDKVKAFTESATLFKNLTDLLGGSDGTTLPFKLVGFVEGLSTEEKLTELVTQAKDIFSLPDNYDELTSEKLIALLKDKLDAFVDLLNHIEVFGFTVKSIYEKAKTPLEKLFSTEGADLKTTEGVVEFILDKCMLLIDIFYPQANASGEEPETTPVSSSSGSAVSTKNETEPTNNNFEFSVKLVLDAFEKAKLVWKYIHDNDLGIKIEDRSDDFEPAKLIPTEFQASNGAAPISENTPEKSTAEPTKSDALIDAGSAPNAQNASAPTSSITSVVSTEQIIRNLLGDRKSGIISKLPREIQDLVLGILDGELQKQVIDEITHFFEDSDIQKNIEQEYQTLKDLLFPQAEGTASESTPPITVASFLTNLITSFGKVYDIGTEFLKKAIDLVIELLMRIIDALFAVVKALKMPDRIRDFFPSKIADFLLGEANPNLLCLVLAVPSIIFKSFWETSVQTMEDWMEKKS